jgi:tetraprenyl-beta-curcumene synthase
METHRPHGALRSALLLALYWLRVFPLARSELRRWESTARAIPDPALQRLALTKLRDEGRCAEGVAAFALLAVASRRAAVVQLCVAFEVMYDLLDGLGELPAVDPLASNRRLARAFAAALDPNGHPDAISRQLDDGGYLNELVAACHSALATLPAFPVVAAGLRRAAERAGEAQSLNHSGVLLGDVAPLTLWAGTLEAPPGLHWWEIASAAAAPLGIYALCALASHPDATAREAARVEAAYFPWIAGLLGILESLVDRDEDAAEGTLSYASHYESSEQVAAATATLARRASREVQSLRGSTGHVVILAGMVATNLSHDGARDLTARAAGYAARADVIGPVGPLLALLRLRRRIGQTARVSVRPRDPARRAGRRRSRARRSPRRAGRRR